MSADKTALGASCGHVMINAGKMSHPRFVTIDPRLQILFADSYNTCVEMLGARVMCFTSRCGFIRYGGGRCNREAQCNGRAVESDVIRNSELIWFICGQI